MSLYKIEFPDYDGKFYCPSGFKDYSYHNDMMPHAHKEMTVNGINVVVNIWQDYVDVDKRENDSGKRYIFSVEAADTGCPYGDVVDEIHTDDLDQIKGYVNNLEKVVSDMLKKNGYVKECVNPLGAHDIVDKILEGVSVREALSDDVNVGESGERY